MIFVASAGCGKANDPDKIAERFVDAYYIEYDFNRAMEMARGPAMTRLKEEKKLVDDAREKVALAASKAQVYYSPPERRAVGDDLVHYTFALDIKHGSNQIARTAVIMVGRDAGGWKVISFREVGEGGQRGPTGERESGGVGTSTRPER